MQGFDAEAARSELERARERADAPACAKKLIIDPTWKPVRVLEFLVVIFSAISSHLAAYYACFGEPEGLLLAFDQVMEVVFGMNIIKNFFKQYRDPNDPAKFIKDFFLIVKHYVRGAFAFDLMALSAWPLSFILR